MPQSLEFLPHLLASLGVVLISVATALHALLSKRHSRSAAGWIAMCVFFPLVGAALYWLFGQNRIYTRAQELRSKWPKAGHVLVERTSPEILATVTKDPDQLETLLAIARTGDRVAHRRLVGGNRITPLHDGEEAYPAMLAAIANAREFVYLTTYILDGKRCLAEFGAALGAAVERGVDVRFLIDGVGELYGWPRAGRVLAERGVQVARFLRPSLTLRGLHINLRNHRKIMVVDGHVGFTGGMNLRDGHYTQAPHNRHPVRDMHFAVEGPIVTELEGAFLDDWGFAEGGGVERAPSPPGPARGIAVCRALPAGPNEDFEVLSWSLLAAIAASRREVLIVTPYFIPSREMTGALATAALSGVSVRILVPEHSNLAFVDWASRAMLWELLERGVRIALQPKPFPHTKYLAVDRIFASIGSANLDPRSLRLNFEFNLEVHDRDLPQKLANDFERDWARSREISAAEVHALPLLIRIRNNLARLLEPYL